MSSPFGTRVLHKKGTLRDSLHKRATETLTREGIANAVLCPDDVDCNEWIAVHAVDFYNDIAMLYGVVHDECTAETCPFMSAGDNFEFLWVDKQRYCRPTRLPAKIYIDFLLNWLVGQLQDESLFPIEESVPFPPDFRERVQSIFRRMYRVYAHIWCSHHTLLVKCKCENNFRFSLNHYLHFVNQFHLVPAKEIRPLCLLVNELAPKLAIVTEMNAIEEAKREQRRQHVPPTSAYQQLVAPSASRSISIPSVRVGANKVAPVSNRVSAFVPFSQQRAEDSMNDTPGIAMSTRESSIYYSTSDIPSNTKETSELDETAAEEISQSIMVSNISEEYEEDDEQRKSCSIV